MLHNPGVQDHGREEERAKGPVSPSCTEQKGFDIPGRASERRGEEGSPLLRNAHLGYNLYKHLHRVLVVQGLGYSNA